MLKSINRSTVKKLLPLRRHDSHKGQNGRLLIVGGSIDYYGPPILAGLGALYSGSDLVYLYVPECNFDAARSMYPDFVVKKYEGNYLSERAASQIVEFGKKCDAVVIGPGLGDDEKVVDGVIEILNNLHIPTVLDADAIRSLKKIEKFPLEQPVVITPHQNEFRNMVDREVVVNEKDSKSVILLRSISMDLNINVLLKGRIDYVSSVEGNVETNNTGNPGMTVGGSGDVLAGLVGSFLAQGVGAYDAARCAAFYMGKAGDFMFKNKGISYSASDIAFALPYVLK
ncbi:NAD(P)H-hydrate dehydratase [Candidatus Peregrinibacteria bacterium]|jgi:ADP-dependent NAD(P)H-hydrate dehydratase / NAD(P)H-hydrate epimerase|nr:NAD(P)H-hydrate dehydratase [Candidatus Peregrinibacteria bacterium]MBT7736455.1 NAD(P)H-hydrate dehydratase [Candidatus Peregrinibacteria bacterium]